ncbi:SusD/RagB family nutrient-binding outer membrane lipoprotein [Salegentibacter salegens]|uniref:Susd and RagB outer membrane lipoprotein n=1 Tax=Salegentibacter salegens TaxID=143223 RepID=A0A1M7HVQ7_9FLAO|nr:SusD/RagB family nutrient-binding outer membrane lipoprotein [Salegentibacter salegens]PRX45231.1 SusD/RagB-like outer membrane lipoprotein [Salegentibacter salegens]SHM32602.1 Susd and RagB outer membrane lipoprotein [Salegentibacter salegens]
MKKYIVALTALVTLWSCQSDEQYEDLNRDPKNPTQVASDFLFTAATVSLSDNMASPNVNDGLYRFLAQYFTTTTYVDETNYNFTARTNPDNVWSEIYRDVILDIQDAKAIVEANGELEQAEKDARMGQLEVIEVYAWHVLVDSFGDIPYSQAGKADEFPLPAYDDDMVIYEDLISRLDNVGTMLSAGQGYVGADVVYGGDMSKWMMFANSLKLRLGMRISDANPGLSQSTVESAVTDGVFMANADNATVEYQGNDPYGNPLWEDLVLSGRSDFLAANTIVDYMNDLNDPRRMVYFDENIEGYNGGIYGGLNNFSSFTQIGDPFLQPTREGILLDYAEVRFNQSRAAELGYNVPGDAETHYNAAITASMEYWGITDEAAISSYLSQGDVAYDGSEEQFATQYWIAMFDNPFQGWSVWRKYDAPELNIPSEFETEVPLRYTYPVDETNLNETNYEAAAEAIGGDSAQTPIFWDVQ